MSTAYDLIENSTGRKVQVQLNIENDDGPFLNLRIETDDDAGRELADVITEDDATIAAFFEAVDEAKAEWETAKAKAG